MLSAFEEIRQPRCTYTQRSEIRGRDFIVLPNGPEKTARDEGMRGALAMALLDFDDADEEYLRKSWGTYIYIFAHDANEAVDDYWSKYGRMLTSLHGCCPDKCHSEVTQISVLRQREVV
jgi:salicylate hydroxylase